MSVDPFIDPQQQAFDDASRDPLEILTEQERGTADEVIEQGSKARTTAEVAVALGISFLLYRRFMRRRLLGSVSPTLTTTALGVASDFYWRQFLPVWVLLSTGPLRAGLSTGMDVHTQDVPITILQAFAEDYAERLGPYLHDTTQQALLEGFTANVNKRMPRKLAAEKSIEALGLSQRQMRALTAVKPPAAVNSVREINPNAFTDGFVEQSLVNRARQIGEQEAYTISQEGRQLSWMYQVSRGHLSVETERVWKTADDERVCKSCGPMDRVTAKVTEKFPTPLGKVWSPSLHPNCRCTMTLKIPNTAELVGKNLIGTALDDFNEDHPRAKAGRFRTKVDQEIAADPIPQVQAPTRVSTVQDGMTQIARLAIPTIAQVTQVAQVTPPVTQVSPPQVDLPQVSAPQVTMPRVEATRLIQAVVEAKVAPVVTGTPQPKPARPGTKVEGTTYTHVHTLDDQAYFLAEDENAYPPYAKNDMVHLTGETFTTQELHDDAIKKASADIIEAAAKSIMATGKNNVGIRETGHKFQFSEENVKDILGAELYGIDNEHNPRRMFASAMGFNRYEHTIPVFVVKQINLDESGGNADAYEGTDEYEIGGYYRVADQGVVDQTGPPVKYIWLDIADPPADEKLD